MARRRAADPKREALSEHGTLNPGAGRIQDPLFLEHEFFDTRDLMQVKYELLRRVREEGHSVTEASAAFGVSRPTFYEALRAFEREGLAGLIPKKRGPRQAHKLGPEVMEFVQRVVSEEGPLRVKELVRKVEERFRIVVHPRSLERALTRLKKKRH
jgi:transposase